MTWPNPFCRVCGDQHGPGDAPCVAGRCVSKGCHRPMSDPLLGLCPDHHRLVIAQRRNKLPERDLPKAARR